MRPFTKDKEKKKETPAPFHLQRAFKKAENPSAPREPKIIVTEAEVREYMKDNGIRTATKRGRSKIAKLIRESKKAS